MDVRPGEFHAVKRDTMRKITLKPGTYRARHINGELVIEQLSSFALPQFQEVPGGVVIIVTDAGSQWTSVFD